MSSNFSDKFQDGVEALSIGLANATEFTGRLVAKSDSSVFRQAQEFLGNISEDVTARVKATRTQTFRR